MGAGLFARFLGILTQKGGMTMQDGFLRAAAASIPVAVADPRRNAAAVCARIDQAHRARAALLVLPELCVTGYTCGDLFLSALLLDAAEEALLNICAHTQNCDPVVVLGVPLRAGGKLYNCAAVLHRGRILGVVPKTWLPNYDVFAEKRCFASAAAYHGPGSVPVSGADVPFGTGLVFACAQMPAFRLGVELCEDVWAPIPPSVRLCLAGATVIANCSASPEAAGKPARRRTLLRAASARGLCGYVYANAGPDESSARAVFSAHHLIAENGDILAEHAPFAPEPGLLVTELDLLTLSAERRRNTTFVPEGAGARAVPFSMPLRPTALSRAVSPHPFVPDDAALRRKRAELLLSIQAHGLRKRLLHTGSRAALLPVTDDLDSVLALLVCARTMDLLGRARHDVLAVTQPGGDRARVLRLCKALGVSVRRYTPAERDSNDGMSTVIGGAPTIMVSSLTIPARQRFTCAHELGHIILGHVGRYDLVCREPEPGDNPIEQAANVFASRLLAPACVLWGCGVQSAGDIERLCDISRAAAEFRWSRMQELYRRQRFLTSSLERAVYAQFEDYIKGHRLPGADR